MEKEFVTYEIALALKELGFDEPCFGRYYYKESYPMLNPKSKETELVFEFGQYLKQTEVTILAPTFSQAFRWFREKYGLVSAVLPFQDVEDNIKLCYYYCVVDLDECQDEDILCNESSLGASDINFSSYEEAELVCLIKLIEIVESKSE